LNHGEHRDHGDRTKDTGGKDVGGLCGWHRAAEGQSPFSVSSVISVVQNLVVPAAGPAVLICEICGSLVFACGRRPCWALGGWIQALSSQLSVPSSQPRAQDKCPLPPAADRLQPLSVFVWFAYFAVEKAGVGSRLSVTCSNPVSARRFPEAHNVSHGNTGHYVSRRGAGTRGLGQNSVGQAPPYGFCSLRLRVSARIALFRAAGGVKIFA